MASCSEVKKLAAHHLQDIRAKIADLTKLERLLAKTIARCSGSGAPDCPVLEILDVWRSNNGLPARYGRRSCPITTARRPG